MQTETNAHPDCARENRQRSEVDAGIIQNDENPDDEHDVTDDLRDGVLQGPVDATFGQEPVEQESFRAGREPENSDEQRDQKKNL